MVLTLKNRVSDEGDKDWPQIACYSTKKTCSNLLKFSDRYVTGNFARQASK